MCFYKHPKGFSWHNSTLVESTAPKCPTLQTLEALSHHTKNSLGTEIISCQPGIVDLQEDIGIVHSGCKDL